MIDLKTYTNSIISPFDEEEFFELFSLKTIPKGTILFKSSEVKANFGFLNEGILRAYYSFENGKEYTKNFFINPCFIGNYEYLINLKPNNLQIEALSECKLLIANYSELKILSQKNNNIQELLKVFAENYAINKQRKQLELATLTAQERYELFNNTFPKLALQIPQYYIASYLGISATQLSRIRSKYKNNYICK